MDCGLSLSFLKALYLKGIAIQFVWSFALFVCSLCHILVIAEVQA